MKARKQKNSKQVLAGIIVLVLVLFAGQASLAAPCPLSLGKTAFKQKNYSLAAKHFQTAVANDPTSCECRLELGRTICKMASTMPKGSAQQKAKYRSGAVELRKAVRLGKGSSNAIAANAILLTLPAGITAPKTGADTPMIALSHGLAGMDRGSEAAKPKILEFYASWCEPCKQLAPLMAKAKSTYGEQVEFISYNVDDPSVDKLVEDYEVSPIPTLIFLDQSNQVVSYSVGYSGEAGIHQGIKKILPKS